MTSSAFEYRQPIPIGKETSLHRKSKDLVINAIQENSKENAVLHFIYGPKYCGKSSFMNSIITILEERFPRKFISVPVKIDIDGSNTLVASIFRQIFDQIFQVMIDQKLIEGDSEIYLDWIAKVDQIESSVSAKMSLRSANLIANSLKDPTKDNLLTAAVLDSDLKILYEIVKSKRSDFRKFVLFLDDFGRYRETLVEKSVSLLLKNSKLDICVNSNSNYREYWEVNNHESDHLTLDYPLNPPEEIEMFVLCILELRRINAPEKFAASATLNDIYETANKEFRNFLIICHLIWQEIRLGRLDKFEINFAVLNGLISIAKKDSAPETIAAIEATIRNGENARISRTELLEVLAYKSLKLREIAIIKNLPKILKPEELENQVQRYEKAINLFTDKGIVIRKSDDSGHSGFIDPVVESYVRFHLRDEKRKDKNKLRHFLADNSYEELMIAVFRRDFVQRLLKPYSLTHATLKINDDEELSWDLLKMVKDRDIFSIYAEQEGRNFDNAVIEEDERFAALEIRLNVRGKESVLALSMMRHFVEGEPSLQEMLENWKQANKDLLEYIELDVTGFRFELLSEEETQDLQALHTSQDTSGGMQAFKHQHYKESRDEFVRQYKRIESLLAKYSSQFADNKTQRKALLRKIADLKMRLAFTELLVGHTSDALITLMNIKEADLEDDISIWIYKDDVANAFAFKNDFEQALKFSQANLEFFRTNIGFLPSTRGATLLQYIPDGIFGENLSDEEIARYHYEREEDSNNLIPVLFNNFLKCKLGRIDRDEFIRFVKTEQFDRPEAPDIAPLRSSLWFLNDLAGAEGVEQLSEALIRHRIPRDSRSKMLYDDLDRIRKKN